MIAVDSRSFIAYLSGADGSDVEEVERALTESQVCLPPVVVTELLSDPKLPASVVSLLTELPVLEVTEGYWPRAGLLRARLLSSRRRARLADTLIAQSCLDHDVPLIARDEDYRHFARLAGLKLFF
ncbi:MAG: PIN domain-containing protein [Thermoanaerobaculia bacterium]